MNKIEYRIKINEYGRPYIDIPNKTNYKPEDKFYCFEIVRYLLDQIYNNRKNILDEDTNNRMQLTLETLDDISDELAYILFEQMNGSNTNNMFLLNKKYHIQVKTIKERDKLPRKNILFNDKVYRRERGLKVLVTDIMKIFELVDGVSNENWKEV